MDKKYSNYPTLVESIYLFLSFIIFIMFFIGVKTSSFSGKGGEVADLLFAMLGLPQFIVGLVLVVQAWERKAAFWMLLISTCGTAGYLHYIS